MSHSYTNREQCEVFTEYLSFGCRSGGDLANTWHWTERLQPSFQTGSSSSPQLLPNIRPYRIPRGSLHYKCHTVFILCINYTIIVTICINNNYNVIINNYCGRLQDLILLFKNPMGTRNNFFEIFGKFGHDPSKRFASPALRPYPVIRQEHIICY